ncbi:MAG: tetratricopeptide repeat protein [Thermodesulfobacteriota bacterium]|nr:tetratricopeptide repeat protein [Thermodesulfobacteriota bacterium]
MKPLTIVSLALVLALAAGPAFTEEKSGFWDTLLKKINRIASHGPQGKAYTSVVGIRGAETDGEADSLYWKGLEQPAPDAEDADLVEEASLAAFRQAVAYAVEGNPDQALEAFHSFMDAYPESELCDDAAAAIAKLESDVAAAPGETPATDTASPATP